MNIIINKHLFAAYCGMIKSGYDLMDLEDEVVRKIVSWVADIDFGKKVSEYFRFARTDTISVNPYYPRGSDLSAACFFQGMSIDKYISFLKICESTEADNHGFIEWISELPDILQRIENHSGFNDAYQYYCSCLQTRFELYNEQMDEVEAILRNKPFDSNIRVEFAPNLLQAKFLTDYVLVEDTLYVISGVFWSCAVIHEYLHIVFKAVRSMIVDIVNVQGIDRYVNVQHMVETGYLHGGTVEDKAHLLEECFVRALTGVVDTTLDVQYYCQQNRQSGFLTVQKMINNMSGCAWYTMSLEDIVLQMIANL